MPTWGHKIFDTTQKSALRRSTSTIAADIGFCMTSRSRCRSCASDQNVSNWFNGCSKATVTFVRFLATRAHFARCCGCDCSTSIAIDLTVSGELLDPIEQASSAHFATGCSLTTFGNLRSTDTQLCGVLATAAGRHRRLTRSNVWLINGQNSRISANVVIVPTSQFDQNTRKSPPAPIIDRRKDASARLPSTNASVNGASGMLSFLKT